MTETDSAATGAELDELRADLIACRDYLVKQLGSAGEEVTIYTRAAAALAALRQQLAAMREDRDAHQRDAIRAHEQNAKMAAALRPLLDHYLSGGDGSKDRLALDAEAALRQPPSAPRQALS